MMSATSAFVYRDAITIILRADGAVLAVGTAKL